MTGPAYTTSDYVEPSYVNVGEDWTGNTYVRFGGTWRQGTPTQVLVGGVWQPVVRWCVLVVDTWYCGTHVIDPPPPPPPPEPAYADPDWVEELYTRS